MKDTMDYVPEPPFHDNGCTCGEDTDDRSICDNCQGCLTYCRYEPIPDEAGFFRLIGAMADEINSLEAEIVRTRHVLTEYLPRRWAEGLRSDIFCNLSRRFTGDFEEYDRYVEQYCNGTDPMESPGQVALMLRLRDGKDDSTYYHLLKKQPQNPS